MRPCCLILLLASLLPAQQAFYYNRPNGLDPLTVGMKNDQPIAIDWDEDGRTDILQRNLYSTTFGEPWWGIYFFRNTGTNRKPRYAAARRLTLDNRPIDDTYASYQTLDYNHDGHPDLLSGIGAGPRKGTLQLYLNQGRRDNAGLPLLKAGPTLAWHNDGGDLAYGMRLIGGDLYTLRMRVQYFPTQILEHTLFHHPAAGPNGFGKAEPLAFNSKTVYDEWPSTQRNGKWLGNSRTRRGPLRSCIVEWADPSQPPRCIADTTPDGFAIPSAAPNGIFAATMGGWLRFLPDRGKPHLVLAEGMPCSFGGYSSVEVADWEGDGDLDFIGGNETGFVQLIENISTPARTQFKTARPIPNVYAARWMFIDDEDPERPYGQSKPAYVDWDNDGDLDLLVGNNSNRIAYFENIGSRRKPKFAKAVKLLHDRGEHFSFRARPAPVDYNNDGLLDLVAGSTGPRDRNDSNDILIALYLRYRDATGQLRLRAPTPLRDTNGQEIRTPIPYHHGFEVADWDNDGDLDLFTNEKSHLVLYRNTGHGYSREPILHSGKPLSISHHETSIKLIDWDKDGQLDLITGGESGWVYFFPRATLR
ncbi:MAG: VCBS repeat-containing protein [Bryobacterales bacterium]|nr:VCBS repeat-containing protein [Bryobacterales bacterium]